MLDSKFIRENIELVRLNIARKNEKVTIDTFEQLDVQRRSIIQEVETLKSKRNTVSSDIAVLKKNKQDASELIDAMKVVSDSIKELDEQLASIEAELENLILYIPNMLHESVPTGKIADDNIEIRRNGECGEKGFRKDHLEIAKELSILDFERGAKVSGSGFGYYVGKGATLERSMWNYFLDTHITDNGYKEIYTPFIVNEDSMRATGQIPKMVEDMYHCTEDNLYLIPTAEVPITNFYRNETLQGVDLPIKLTGFSACFRREAGSYGKDSRGFLRVHQFNKVELVHFSKPEDSYTELEGMVHSVEKLLQALQLPYRVILLCSGDTSFSSAKTYDIEVWSPCEQKWLEVSSCSNFEDFQARRASIKYKENPNAKPSYLHTLNGSGLATSRIMVALLEHYQQEDGSIRVPEVLQPYCRFDIIENN
jgi:seryl-tRNA synthetase